MNKIILTGRLTVAPELRQTQSGISFCRFTVAVNRRFKNKDTDSYDTDFISCRAWRQTADFISKYFKKGQMIALEGTLQNNNYEKDGVQHYSYIVIAENAEFCGSKCEEYTQNRKSTKEDAAISDTDLSEFEEILSDGDVPF